MNLGLSLINASTSTYHTRRLLVKKTTEQGPINLQKSLCKVTHATRATPAAARKVDALAQWPSFTATMGRLDLATFPATCPTVKLQNDDSMHVHSSSDNLRTSQTESRLSAK